MSDPKPGLRIESAASVILRDTIQQHMAIFAHVIRTDRAAGQSVAAVYIDGLAGTLALVISGTAPTGQSKELIVDAVVTKLREAIDRDLRHLETP